MRHRYCLNCGKELKDQYCSGCGQKADTHRITFKNFIFHDVLHGTLHLDRGMLFTAKQALVRPGKAALDYIAGKRRPYYNVFYLILITIGLTLFFRHFNAQLGGGSLEDPAPLNEASKKLNEIFFKKSRIIIFLFVPFAALNSYILFRRKKLNLSEHAIISGMILLGMLLISLLGILFFYLDLLIPFSVTFADVMSYLITVLVTLHIGYGYFNAFGKDYSRWGISYRILLFYLLLVLEIMLLFMIVFGFITDWRFGRIRISPF